MLLPDCVEFLIVNACVVLPSLKKEDPPKAEWKDECRGCDFQDYCFESAPLDMSNVFDVRDPELIAMVARHQEIKAIAKEYKDLDKTLKDSLGDSTARVGDFLFKVTKFNATAYNVPPEIKVAHKTTVERTRKTFKPLIKAL